MTITELIETLSEFPQDTLLLLSKDGEGNAYSPLSGYSTGRYSPDSTWSGEFQTTENDEEEGITEDDWYEDDVFAICLWPIN